MSEVGMTAHLSHQKSQSPPPIDDAMQLLEDHGHVGGVAPVPSANMAPIPDRSGVAYDIEAQASCFRVSPKKDKEFNAVLQPLASPRTGRRVMGWSV